MPKRRDEGEGAPFAEGRPRHQLLAAPAPAPDRRHVRLGPCFVDENDFVGIDLLLRSAPLSTFLGNVGALLLAGD